MGMSDGERLFIYRTMGGWTQAELGAEFNCHQTYIAAMERDERPVRDDISHFSDKLPMAVPAHVMMSIMRKRKKYAKHTVSALTGVELRLVGQMERGLIPIDSRIEDLLSS